METIKYELKYCERCGTLKLRRVASGNTYCSRCEGLLARYGHAGGKDKTDRAASRLSPELKMPTAMPVASVSAGLAGRAQ